VFKQHLKPTKLHSYQIYRGRLKLWKILLLIVSVTPNKPVPLTSLYYLKYSKFRYLSTFFTQPVARLIGKLYSPISDNSNYKYQTAFCLNKFSVHQ